MNGEHHMMMGDAILRVFILTLACDNNVLIHFPIVGIIKIHGKLKFEIG